MEREGLLGEAKRIGARLGDGLRSIADDGLRRSRSRRRRACGRSACNEGQDAMKIRDRMLELGVITRAIANHTPSRSAHRSSSPTPRSTASSTPWRRPPRSDVVRLFDNDRPDRPTDRRRSTTPASTPPNAGCSKLRLHIGGHLDVAASSGPGCWWCSRAPTRAARAAPSSASSSRSTRATTGSRRSPSRASTRSASTSCGGSGRRCPGSGRWRCSIARGTGACWSSGSRATPPRSSGSGPTTRSSSSSAASCWRA